MSKDLTTVTSVTLRRSVLSRISRHAKELDRSTSWLVNHACEQWLADKPPLQDEAAEADTDADGE
jgi:predicted transcriptional regulator